MIANPAFDYTPVNDPEKVQKSVERIKRWSADCDRHAQKTAELAIKIGTELIATKEDLPYGLWGHWLRSEFGWSERTAQRFMAIARRFTSANLADLSMAVLESLSGDSVPEEARAEVAERSKRGEKVTAAQAKAIVASHQPNKVSESKPASSKKSSGASKAKGDTKRAEKNRISEEIAETYGSEPSEPAASPVIEPKPALSANVDSPAITAEERKRRILELAAGLSLDDWLEVRGEVDRDHGIEPERASVAEKTPVPVPEARVVPAQQQVVAPPAAGMLIPFDAADMKPPPSLDTPKFLEWWRKWVQYNIDAGQPLTQLVAEEQMVLLVARRVESAISTIRQTIANRQFAFPKARETRPSFVPPTVEEVDAYIKERGITSFTGEGFVDHYKRTKWRLGNDQKMADWKATVRDWHNKDKKRQKEQEQSTPKGSAAVGGAYEIFKPTRRKSNDSGAPAPVRA